MPSDAFRKQATSPSSLEGRRLWYIGQAEALCYLVARGKLAAWLLVPKVYLSDVRAAVAESHCACVVSEQAGGWAEVWVYYRPLAAELIGALPVVRALLPAAVSDWYVGSLCGYSTPAIESYIAGGEGREPLSGEFRDEGPGDAGLIAGTTRRQRLALVDDDRVAAVATLVASRLRGAFTRLVGHVHRLLSSG